jgi:beta-phosphoglucomutase family hydrolase
MTLNSKTNTKLPFFPPKGAYLPVRQGQRGAVIFDMDGVLVNSEPHHIVLEKRLFNDIGIVVSEEEHLSYMGKPAARMWQEIKQNKGLKNSQKELTEKHREAAGRYFEELDKLEPEEGLIELLEELYSRNIPLAVASSSTKNIIDIILRKTGLRDFFKVVVSAEDVENGKPSPDIFLHAAELLGVKPEKCVVIEDSQNGIKAAKAAGMFCVAYIGTTDGNADTGNADAVIGHFKEL